MRIVDGGRVDLPRRSRARKALVAALLLCGGLAAGHEVASAQVAPGPGLAPWTTTTSLPAARARNGAVYGQGYLYDVGGVNSAGDTIDDVFYAPVNANGTIGAWGSTSPLPGNRRTVRPAFYNGFLYYAGGNDGADFRSEVYYAAINANGTLTPWAATTPLPATQTSHATVAYDGYLYVIGGNLGATCTSTVLYAPINPDGTLGAWSTTNSLPGARCGNVEAATVANGRIYAIGGYNNSDVTSAVYYTNINGNGTLGNWQTNATSLTQGREYHGIETMNGYLYAIAGQPAVSGNPTAAVEVATINANGSVGTWSNTASLPAARGELATEMVNGYLYAIGGGTGQSGSSPQATVYYTTAASVADPTPPTVSLASPGATVSGTVTLNATASDNVGVAGVQFLVDGNPIGAEDTTSPYSVSWDTVTVSNGGHILTARARDAAGNQTTSTGVPVSVNNAAGPGPIVAYGMNEGSGPTTADSSGNANTGALTSTAWTPSGRYSSGLVFNGTSSRVRANANVTLGTAFTYEAWVLNPGNAAYETVMTVGSNRDFYLNFGVLTFWTGNNDVTFGTVPTGSWQHVALTYNGTTLRAYLNGNQLGNATNVALASQSGPLQVGSYIYGGGNADYFSGTIDEARVYTRALSAAEIGGDMNTPINPPADTTPPVLSGGQPTGTLPTGTTQTNLQVISNEAATCRYSSVAGTSYASMTNTFTTTGATNHSTNVTGLTNGNTYSFYVRCQDTAGNPNTADFTITFSVAAPDGTPPVLSGGQPTGTLPAGTTQTNLQVVSNEAATCRYSSVAGTSYASMTNTFTTTGATNHSTNVTGLTNGNTYNFYVRCQDTAGNPNTADFTITFSVANPDVTPPTVSVVSPGATVSGTVTVTANAADNVGVAGVQFYVDGNPIGAEDTTSPYSVSWTTTSVPNGSHALTARARDAAGNQTTSAPVNVTVNNTVAGPIVAYGMNENGGATTADSSGNANTGTLTSTTWAPAGRYGAGLVFNGTSSRVRANANITLGTPFTYEAWVLNPANAAYETIMTVGSNRDLYLASGVLTFWTGANDVTFGTLPTGSWQHVALTYDGTSLRAYLNGTQLGATAAATLTSQAGALQLASWITGANNVDYFSGTLDEVRVYNRALSAAEIATDRTTPI